MSNVLTDEDLFKRELGWGKNKYNHVPFTEKVKALRSNYEISTGFGVETEYTTIPMVTVLNGDEINNILVVSKAIVRDLNKEGYPIVSTGTDSKFFRYFFERDSAILEEVDFISKAESGAISRALTHLGIALPSHEELSQRHNDGAPQHHKTGGRMNLSNPSAPGQTYQTNDSIEQLTGLTVGELRKDGGKMVEFNIGDYVGQFQLKYNPEKKSYYWSNVDKQEPNKANKYIATTVK